MKILAIAFFAAGVWVSSAQTSTNTNANTNGVDALLALVTTNHPAANSGSPKLSRGPMHIDSDGAADFDFNRHWVTYCNHVVVSDAQMKLTCEWLGANLPQHGERMTNIVAETNVVMDFVDEKGQQTRALGDKAVYYFHTQGGVTNETVTLTANPPGKPRIVQAQNSMTGDVIIWDRTTDQVHVTGNFRGEYFNTNSAAGTNKANPFLK